MIYFFGLECYIFNEKYLQKEEKKEMNYKEAPYSKFHKMLFLCAVLGQIACGFALGIAGTAVTEGKADLGLNTFWVGLLGAGTLIGLAGSLVVGNLADKIGRSKLVLLDMVFFTIFSIAQFFTSSVAVIMVLRILIGLCIAVDYTVGSTIVSEWFDPETAPSYLSKFIIYWTFGYVLSFFAGLVMSNLHTDYHIIFASSAVTGAIAAIARIVCGIPESPSWMASVGKVSEANKLVAEKLGSEYKVVVEEKKEEEKVSVAELFSPKYRRNTLVGGMFYACQVFPYFGVGIFLPILIGQLNMGDANTSSIIYDVFCMVGAFAGTWLCARMSRRSFLTSTFFGAAIALVVMIIGQNISIIITVIAFAAYALIMSIAVVMEWPYPPELFDDRVRGTGVGIVVAFSRIGAALGTFLLPILMDSIGGTGTLIVCAAVLVLGGVVCQLFAPETSASYLKKVGKEKAAAN